LTPDGSLQRSELELSEDALLALPQSPAVFRIATPGGRPYLARTSVLRRRALRLLGKREGSSRVLHLREAFSQMDYWLTGSALDASMTLYEIARQDFPESYQRVLRLRMPPYLKLLLGNAWPRTMVTTQAGSGTGLTYGPFRSRAAAEYFESQYLELFQVRRCQEDLAPAPDHPGCLWGEVGKCLRPCQLAVSREEYGGEVARASEFLRTNGQSMIRSITAARDALSAEMEFEEAARQHRQLERVEGVLKARDELASDAASLQAVAVARSALPNTADLFLVRDGQWLGRVRLDFELQDGKPVSVDRKLRELWAGLGQIVMATRERQERVALLARWFYSTWRDGELLMFDRFDDPPVRKIVNALGRVMGRSEATQERLPLH
jgi:excinuclease UvrABC nuclease subunit